MQEYDEFVTRAAAYQQAAKDAQNDDDRHSWLAQADSWLQTAELQQILKAQERTAPEALESEALAVSA